MIRLSRLELATLALLGAFTAAAVTGYAVFALHPERLARTQGAAAAYGLAMAIFPRGHIVLGLVATGVVLSRYLAARWLPAFGAVYVASLGSELLGTTVGLPFGPYEYTAGLGIKWFGHVPVLIPASWFTMSMAAFVLTRRWLGVRDRMATIVFASFVLGSWDLVLDPAMSRLAPYWLWGSSGPYYGMPLLNLVGWYVTGLVLMALLVALGVDRWAERLPASAVSAFAFIYAANLALPVGLTLAGGMPGAALTAMAALALVYGVGRLLHAGVASPATLR
jgi:putative membrane protein